MNKNQRRITTLLALPILSLTLSACSGSNPQAQAQPTPTATPETPEESAANWEAGYQAELGGESLRLEARRAAMKAVVDAMPSASIKGVSSFNLYANHYRVTVDVDTDGKRRSVEYLVRQFFPVGGEPYWKADLLNQPLPELVETAREAQRRKAFKQAERDIDSLRDQRDGTYDY